MGKKSVLEKTATPFHIIFTDLDGTLLDHDTYDWKDAEPALDLCKKLGVSVVFVSSKTRAEMEDLRGKMAISGPFISENGGGIFFSDTDFQDPPANSVPVPNHEGMWKLSVGLPYSHLIRALQEIREELGLNLKGFSDMRVKEISHLTGLDGETARMAAVREFDEPFLIDDKQPGDESAVIKAAEQRGLSVATGGRFYHLQGGNDKGQSMEMVISWYEQSYGNVTSIALGDSPNDFSMLERADYPVLVRSQHDFPWLKEKIHRLRISREKGPAGWNSMVLTILKTRLIDEISTGES
jgi:mannosyl-3-phosphoglycerate phosphatase